MPKYRTWCYFLQDDTFGIHVVGRNRRLNKIAIRQIRALTMAPAARHSQGRLIGLLTRLGMDVEIVVRPKARKRQAEGTVSVVFA